MDEAYKRHSRRSNPNLQHYSLTPLTPQHPLPLSIDINSRPRKASISYLSPRSLPQTPSILSRSPSRTRLRPKTSKSSHTLADLPNTISTISTSKSSSYLSQHGQSRSSNSKSSSSANIDWLLQTASALANTTAESKGQSWLTTRSSSISLGDTPAYDPLDTNYITDTPRRRASSTFADDEFSSPTSIRFNPSSKPSSRYPSSRNSRRGSRVGLMTLSGLKSPGEEEDSERAGKEGPRWIDVDEVDEALEEWVDEGEMRRVVWGRVGGWVDWAVGWMDFRGDEIEGEMEGEEVGIGDLGQVKEEGTQEDVDRGKQRRMRVMERERARERGDGERVEVVELQGEGGWRDAAWLLSVAAKVLV